MTYIIKSSAAHAQCEQMENVNGARTVITPRASIVQVFFAERGVKLAYFNDSFDIKKGDTVYVEGSMEGITGLFWTFAAIKKYDLFFYSIERKEKGELYCLP